MTAQEIFAAVCNPTNVDAFRASLIQQAEQHDDYALRCARDKRAAQGAIAQRDACLRAYDHARYGAIGDICADIGTCVVALNAACKLLGIGPAQRTKALLDLEETQRARGLWPS